MARIELFGNDVGIEEIGTWDGAIHFRMTFPPYRVADLDGLVPMMTLPGHDEPRRVVVFENSVARITIEPRDPFGSPGGPLGGAGAAAAAQYEAAIVGRARRLQS